MQMDSCSWHADGGIWYSFDIWTSVPMQDQTPHDYEEEFNDTQVCGRLRYCHALFDRHNDPDPSEICNIFRRNLFGDSVNFAPWELDIPQEFELNCDSKIFNYVDSTCRAERNKNTYKLLIVAAFGLFGMNCDTDHEYYSDDDDGGIGEEVRFVPATKSSIEALEEIADLGSEFECVICFEEEKKRAKRMPCGHVFHERCIEEWLEKSHLCPVCRYAMPSDS